MAEEQLPQAPGQGFPVLDVKLEIAPAARERVARRRPDDLVVVVVPDGGRNYLSKIFDDGWMASHGFGEDS